MGQKTHPKGFRLVTTQKHLSSWYGNKFLYSSLIEEDSFIRLKISDFFKDYLTISKIEISRITQEEEAKDHVNITINALFPRAKEMSRKVSKYFSENTEANNSKTFNAVNNSKGNLKRFTSLLLKRTIRNAIRFFQLKTKKIITLILNLLKILLKMLL